MRTVTAPASRQLSGRGRHRTRRHPLGGLLRGIAVDVSMPGSCVYVAYDNKTPVVRMANGTSYAVAHLAAAAAVAGASRPPVVDQQIRGEAHPGRVSHNLALAGVCVVPPGWDPDYGVGRVDLLALLKAPLPGRRSGRVGAFGHQRRRRGSSDRGHDQRGSSTGEDPARRTAQGIDHDELNRTIAEHEGELVYTSSPIGSLQSPWHNPGRSVPFLPRSALPVSPATWASG